MGDKFAVEKLDLRAKNTMNSNLSWSCGRTWASQRCTVCVYVAVGLHFYSPLSRQRLCLAFS